MYVLTFYVHPPKFCGQKAFLAAWCKNEKKSHVNSNFVAPKFIFFTHAIENVFFSRNLVSEHKIYLDVHQDIFFNFFGHLKIWFLYSGCIYIHLWVKMDIRTNRPSVHKVHYLAVQQIELLLIHFGSSFPYEKCSCTLNKKKRYPEVQKVWEWRYVCLSENRRLSFLMLQVANLGWSYCTETSNVSLLQLNCFCSRFPEEAVGRSMSSCAFLGLRNEPGFWVQLKPEGASDWLWWHGKAWGLDSEPAPATVAKNSTSRHEKSSAVSRGVRFECGNSGISNAVELHEWLYFEVVLCLPLRHAIDLRRGLWNRLHPFPVLAQHGTFQSSFFFFDWIQSSFSDHKDTRLLKKSRMELSCLGDASTEHPIEHTTL
jgi:hypothetical protein